MDLGGFYRRPYTKESGQRLLDELESRIGDPE
jgi:hypothetical protein